MLDLLYKTLLAYLIGTIMGGKLLGALLGIDLGALGSGNVGATNALRTQGKGFALGVLAIDVAKGVVATLAVPQLPTLGAPLLGVAQQAYVCGVAAALGHCFPVFYGFKGGKGVATLAGVFSVLLGGALGWMLAAFVLVVMLSGYASLATLAAAAAALVWVTFAAPAGILGGAGLFTLTMSLLVVWTHRQNIGRLWRGEEHRFEKARVLGRWLRR